MSSLCQALYQKWFIDTIDLTHNSSINKNGLSYKNGR